MSCAPPENQDLAQHDVFAIPNMMFLHEHALFFVNEHMQV